MTDSKNFLRRALDAIVEGRQREAQRYVDRFNAEHERGVKSQLRKR